MYNGIYIESIINNGPAYDTRLNKGDIIIKLGKREISGLADLRYELYKYNPKDENLYVWNKFIYDSENQTTTKEELNLIAIFILHLNIIYLLYFTIYLIFFQGKLHIFIKKFTN